MATGPNRSPHAIDRLWLQVMASPELHLHQVDLVREAGLFVRMPPGAYRTASFLDGRSFGADTSAGWMPLQVIRETVLRGPAPATPLHFIFHMGHTGSTLLSRLLDETALVQSLREPLVMRELASIHDSKGDATSLASPADIEALTEVMLRLWSRCRAGRQCAIVKATSSTARIAAALLGARPAARAVYLSMAPEPYLAVILGGPASLMDIRGHAVERMRRLIALLGPPPAPLHALGPGELVALSWLTESLTSARLARTVGERLLGLDFDAFLAEVPAHMLSVLDHFGLPGGADLADRIGRSPPLGRYSKAPEHAYSKRLRQDVIEASRRENRAEIEQGMALLRRLAAQHREVADLLGRPG